MGVDLRLSMPDEEDYTTRLSSSRGWSLLCEYFMSLDDDKFPALKALARDGSFVGTNVAGDELELMLEAWPPSDPDVEHTAYVLLAKLRGGDSEETMTVEP